MNIAVKTDAAGRSGYDSQRSGAILRCSVFGRHTFLRGSEQVRPFDFLHLRNKSQTLPIHG
jgi:hypothetical protein